MIIRVSNQSFQCLFSVFSANAFVVLASTNSRQEHMMKKKNRRLPLLLLAAPLAASLAQQPEGFPPNDPESWRLAGTAKVFCSAIFVSGRDSAEVRDHISRYFLGPNVDSLTSVRIDRQRKLVRLTLANRTTRE